MNNPLVSVVIPTYNGGKYLGDAIQSVLDQTYTNYEIIIVDDLSPENISTVLTRFTDSRIKYIKHDENRGAVAARKTGVHASSGEIIAFLDQDDVFHKQKLAVHVNYLYENPEVGLSYDGRFEVVGEEKIVCGIYNPPGDLSLEDWVTGFPVSPSNTVLVRQWALMDEIWDYSFALQSEHVIFNGQEIVFGGRLALAGCNFGNVYRVLSYRRYHPYRVLNNLFERCQTELACQEIIFSDSRCPENVREIKNLAFSNIYIMWAYTAYIQEEYELGKDFLKHALVLNPEIFIDSVSHSFLHSWLLWISAGTADYVRSPEEIIRSIFDNLPKELQYLRDKTEWAVARGDLLKGLRTMIWGEQTDAEIYLETAIKKGADIDAQAMGMFSDELLSCEVEVGDIKSREVLNNLSQVLLKLKKKRDARLLIGSYAINRAFRKFHNKKYDVVPKDIVRAIKADPKYLLNRGALSVLLRSIWRQAKLGEGL